MVDCDKLMYWKFMVQHGSFLIEPLTSFIWLIINFLKTDNTLLCSIHAKYITLYVVHLLESLVDHEQMSL